MKKEKAIKQKVRHYLDGIYCKSEVTELLKNMQNPEMQNIIEEVADELWEENMEQPPFHSDIEHEQYRREAATLLKKINKRSSYKKIMWVAACITLIIMIGLGVNSYRFTQIEKPLYTEISTSFGEKKEWTLPDGSKVNLKACTTLRYPERCTEKERKIELTGEAFFQVNRDEKKPFIIKTAGFDVKVLGTCFDVKSYENNETSLVSVKSGKVQVELPEAMMKLVANEQLQINRQSNEYTKRKESYQHAMAWLQNTLHYNKTPLYDVIKDLERIYNCRIKFAPNQQFNYHLSGEHDNINLQAVLKSIGHATGVKYKKEKDYILLYQ